MGSKLYWYGSGGEILSETDAMGATLNDYIFFGGKRVALVPASGSALYYAEDTLGSSRVIVQSSGTLCYDADFTPFGGEKTQTSTCAQNYKFEGKERDTETQNDDFGARYYSWRFGRWLSSDWSAAPVPVPYANLTNPQTLNLYSMVHDDPESFADLDGHQDYAQSNSNNACYNTSSAECAASQSQQKADQGEAQNASLVADIANIVEVSGSAGIGGHGEVQVGTVELSGGYNIIGVEGTTGLAGGNANATVLTGVQGEAKVPGAGVEGKAGAELSTKEGATIGASVSGHAGPVSGEVKVDTNGVHTSAKVEAKKDIKLGLHLQIGVGVGVTVNLSQATRAAEHAADSGLALANYLYNKYLPSGSIF